jgi:hypothetical protein
MNLALLLAGSVVCLGIIAFVWRFRARAARFQTIFESYADRQIAQERRAKRSRALSRVGPASLSSYVVE